MKKCDVKFELSYLGADADDHEIDLYDISLALVGFQRSLAIFGDIWGQIKKSLTLAVLVAIFGVRSKKA
jgi:hypothetical protein